MEIVSNLTAPNVTITTGSVVKFSTCHGAGNLFFGWEATPNNLSIGICDHKNVCLHKLLCVASAVLVHVCTLALFH